MTLRRIDFPVLARGIDREAPLGTLNPQAAEGPLWREMNNLVPHEGVLRRREAMVSVAGWLPTFLDTEDQSVVGLFEIVPGSFNERWLMVTTRELFLGVPGAWTNMTPRYTTGTVSITNGTATLTGVGTDWLTRRIRAGQQVELPDGSGAWYKILTVTSDTSITLTSNFTGTTLAGADHVIRRTFAMGLLTEPAVFAASLNGDLYIAGQLTTGQLLGSATTVADGGIIKIAGGANVAKSSFDPTADTTFVTSGATEIVAGLDNLGYNITVAGLTVLSDGRLVLLTDARFDLSVPDASYNRVHYSSPLNLAVWTASPGGFTDVVGYEGAATAMTGGARGVYVHFADGIEIGDLTGALDPPLRFRPSQALMGSVGARMVATIPGGRAIPPGDLFVAADAGVYIFSGGDATPVDWISGKTTLTNVDKSELWYGFSRVDTFRGYASFFFRDEAGGNSRRTIELRVYYNQQVAVDCDYKSHLTAAATPLFEGSAHDRSDVAGYVGTRRFDRAAAATGFVYELRDDTFVDAVVNTTGGGDAITNGVFATTDSLTDPIRKWATSHVDLFYLGAATGNQSNFAVKIIRDSVTETAAVTPAVVTGREGVVRAFPTAASGRSIQIRLELTDPTSALSMKLTRMMVFLADVGEARTG